MSRPRPARLLAFALLVLSATSPVAAADFPSPEQFAGHPIAEEGKLVRWDKIAEYLNLAGSASDRVTVREMGKSTLGNPFLLVFVSSARNLARLDEIQTQQKRLAYPYDLSEEEAARIADTGPAVLLITSNIHATEIGGSQMPLEFVHRLATEQGPWAENILNNVLLLLVPSFNPDGQIMVVDWYRKNYGTEYELSRMPWIYHPYTGHDNNRDAFTLTQVESRLVNDILYRDWFPQVYLDQHQMGNREARIWVPPFANPINLNVDPLIWAENGELGFAMNTALQKAELPGVSYDSTYTSWWQGAFMMQAWWHNMVGLLTETASAAIATTITQEKSKLGVPPSGAPVGNDKFLDMLEEDPETPLPAPRDVMPRNNYPRPWLGGEWSLRDVVDYQLTSAYGLLEAVADRKASLIRNHAMLSRRAIEKGKDEAPRAFVIPAMQHDTSAVARLVNILGRMGVEVGRAEEEFEVEGRKFIEGDFVISMAQPYRAVVKDLLEKQSYPDPARMPAGAMRPSPYDVTAWTLPLQFAVETVSAKQRPEVRVARVEQTPPPAGSYSGHGISRPAAFLILAGSTNNIVATNRLFKQGAKLHWLRDETADRAAGALLVTGTSAETIQKLTNELGLRVEALSEAPKENLSPLSNPRVGLYQPWTASMDEGWTRWLLEHYEFPFTILHDGDIKEGRLREKLDVIILPADRDKKQIVEGENRKWVRPEYKGGIGDEGARQIEQFAADGGTLIAVADSTEFVLETMPLPLKNSLKDVPRSEFNCPGSLLHMAVDTTHPVGYGMKPDAIASFDNGPVFELAPSFSYTDVRVIARYPSADVLASGWLHGERHLQDHIAAAEVRYKKGRVILFGFRPQFRTQPHNTLKLLFNALLYSRAEQPARARAGTLRPQPLRQPRVIAAEIDSFLNRPHLVFGDHDVRGEQSR